MKSPVALCATALTVAAAFPAVGADHGNPLIIRERNYHETVVAGGTAVLGSLRAGMGELYSADGVTRIGSILMSCVNTEVADGKLTAFYCSGVMRTKAGSLAFASGDTDEDTANRAYHYIVTGGDGVYAGMRGFGVDDFSMKPSTHTITLYK